MSEKKTILKKRKDFLRVARGVHVVTTCVIVQAALNLSKKSNQWRVGYTATKKIGKAYVRNRSKRRLRAGVRQIFPQLALPNAEYVLISRHNTHYCPFALLLKDLKYALKKINEQLLGGKR